MADDKKTKSEPLGEFIRTMNDLFQEKPGKGFLQSIDDFFKNPFPLHSFHVETIDTGKETIITAELPGVKKEQLNIEITGNYITISVTQNELITEEDEINKLYRRKQMRQSASRTIALSQPINEKEVKASYRNGLLEIRIPKINGKIIQIDE
ncbi:MAG: Hsp20/alpha crystallin family protein [Bacillota bacterium]|nr:Hsp20/alpha crystallin family protein [Bacillota bacterium]